MPNTNSQNVSHRPYRNMGRAIRKIGLVLSLMAVVSLAFAASGYSAVPADSSNSDKVSQIMLCMDGPATHHEAAHEAGHDADYAVDHDNKHSTAHDDCSMHACPYSSVEGSTLSTALQISRVDFSYALKAWQPFESIPLKRPPRALI